MDTLNLNQLLNILQLAAMVGGAAWGLIKIGKWFGELTGSIQSVLVRHEERLDEHGQRITVLEDKVQ